MEPLPLLLSGQFPWRMGQGPGCFVSEQKTRNPKCSGSAHVARAQAIRRGAALHQAAHARLENKRAPQEPLGDHISVEDTRNCP